MILLNKFMFSNLERLKESLSIYIHSTTYYELDSHLSKNISMFRTHKETYMYYFGKKLRMNMNKSYDSFINYTFIEQLKIRFMCKRFIRMNRLVVKVYFIYHKDNTRLCTLTPKPVFHRSNKFSFSDDKSITNVMNILRNEAKRHKM